MARQGETDRFFRELLEGQHDAHHRLYDLYGREIFRYIKAQFFFRDALAEDILQEVFLAAYIRIRTLRDIGQVRPWLYRIAVNKCLDCLRKHKSELKRLSQWRELRIPEDGDRVDKKIMNEKLTDCIGMAVAVFPSEIRQVLVLRHFQDLPYREIAQILNISLPRTRRLLEKGMRMLLKQLRMKGIDRSVLNQ